MRATSLGRPPCHGPWPIFTTVTQEAPAFCALTGGASAANPHLVIGVVETRGFEPLTPCVQTRISADSRQITKRRQGAQLRVPPAFSFRRYLSAGLRSVTVVSVRLRWLRHAEGTGVLPRGRRNRAPIALAPMVSCV